MNHFFQQLNCDLKQSDEAFPKLILDQYAFQQNLEYVAKKFKTATHLKPRLVVKSLACLELIKRSSQYLDTQRFMVFHYPQLLPIIENFSVGDILMGKPMPVSQVRHFYTHHSQWQDAHIQWLIDTPTRLKQYLEIAQQYAVRLSVNIEIDVGLHRGGISSIDDLTMILKLIEQYPEHLIFSGLMGYDAHVTKLPSMLKKADVAYQESQDIYQNFIHIIQQQFPNLWRDDLCLNGGGSPSFCFHVKHSVCNDLSFGSMLLKPSDFDSEELTALIPALWIATPILKVLPFTELPGMTLLNKLPHKNKALFVYGGYWMADYVYPEGIHPHALYGRSSNQEMVNVPKSSEIDVDDFVFLRPTQSEAIIPQFSKLYVYENRNFEEWETFRE